MSVPWYLKVWRGIQPACLAKAHLLPTIWRDAPAYKPHLVLAGQLSLDCFTTYVVRNDNITMLFVPSLRAQRSNLGSGRCAAPEQSKYVSPQYCKIAAVITKEFLPL